MSPHPGNYMVASPTHDHLPLTFQNRPPVAASDAPAILMVAMSGSIAPPGLSHRSLACSTVSSMVSKRRAYPIHSLTRTSTCGSTTKRRVVLLLITLIIAQHLRNIHSNDRLPSIPNCCCFTPYQCQVGPQVLPVCPGPPSWGRRSRS